MPKGAKKDKRAKRAKKTWRPATRLIQGGYQRSFYQETSEALFLTSGYVYDSAQQAEARFQDREEGYIYSRYANPTVRAFEERMAALEGAEDARATASGMAAVSTALFSFLKAGDHLVAARQLFGACRYVMESVLPRFGIEVTLIDGTQSDAWRAAISKKTRAFFLETPTNPNLMLVDLEKVGAIAKEKKIRLVVDNVFATAVLQKPLLYGADIVVYSATKHIDGQGRCLAGCILGKKDYIEKELTPYFRNTGPALSPFNGWVMLKSLETLPLRMRAHCENAMHTARFLEDCAKEKKGIVSVFYPGLPSHPHYALAQRQMEMPGALIAFTMKNKAQAFQFIDHLSLIKISNNLGDAKSLIVHPATTTHSRLSEKARLQMGVSQGLLRLSVGLEDPRDICGDIEQALRAVS